MITTKHETQNTKHEIQNTKHETQNTKHILFAVFLLLSGCSNERDIHDYYYPLNKLRTGLVYEYSTINNGAEGPSEYWYYRTFARDSGVFLASTYYDYRYQIGQIIREKITPSGALARNYFLYETDSLTGHSTQTAATIESASLFPFEVRDSLGVFLFSLKYHPPGDSATTIALVRNRRFLGNGPDFVLDGKSYSTIRFRVREAIANEQEGAAEITGIGEEHYAKDIGLVYSSKTYSNGKFTMQSRLKSTMTMGDFEKKASAASGE
jgi:hypothetical protein